MEPVEIIGLSCALLNQITKAIQMANEGDAAGAEKLLRDARQHFSDSVAAWDAA
jgi:cellobiose-specific phosphotransferase system component IIA